jgi:hypothetical protein
MKLNPMNSTLAALLLVLLAGPKFGCGSHDADTGEAVAGGSAGADGSSTGGAAGTDAAPDATATLPTCATQTSPDLAHAPSELLGGISQAQWGGVEWFEWAMSLPATGHPVYDGGDCSQGQDPAAPVWFLGSPRPGSPTYDCTVPQGKSLVLMPLAANVVADESDYTCSGYGQCPAPEAVFKQFCDEGVSGNLEDPKDLCVQVDGVAVENMAQYRFESGMFRAKLNLADPAFALDVAGPYPEKASVECAGGVDECADGEDRHFFRCGYWVVLEPLPVGSYTIRMHHVYPPDATGARDFRELTYNLTVQ